MAQAVSEPTLLVFAWLRYPRDQPQVKKSKSTKSFLPIYIFLLYGIFNFFSYAQSSLLNVDFAGHNYSFSCFAIQLYYENALYCFVRLLLISYFISLTLLNLLLAADNFWVRICLLIQIRVIKFLGVKNDNFWKNSQKFWFKLKRLCVARK